MKKKFFFLAVTFVFATVIFAQSNTVLPFTGAQLFAEGITADNIEITVDGYNLTNNTVGINKEVIFRFQQPKAFVTDANKNSFAAAEVTLLDANGKILSVTPNVLSSNSTSGFSPSQFKEIKITVGLRQEVIKSNNACTIAIKIFDLKSKKLLRLRLPVVISKPGDFFFASKGVVQVKANDASVAYINNVKVEKIVSGTDTTIKVNATMAYHSLEISKIAGVAMATILTGTESFYVYEQTTLQEVKIKDRLLKKVNGTVEGVVGMYTLKIPYRLKTDNKKYVVRFRWQSKDKKQIIDIVTNK